MLVVVMGSLFYDDYLEEISADLVGGLENPAIYQNYVEEMNGAIVKLNSFAALLL